MTASLQHRDAAEVPPVWTADDGLVSEIADVLAEFQGEESLKRLFWQALSYDRERVPLPPRLIPETVRPHVDELELYATHGDVRVVRARAPGGLDRPFIERLCRSLIGVMPSCIVILCETSRCCWTLIYPDDTKKALLRFLPLPGPISERVATARALAALSAWDPSLSVPVGWLDITSRLEIVFPGATPATREDLVHLGDYLRDVSRFPTLTAPQERGEDIRSSDKPPDGCPMDLRLWRLAVCNLRFVVWMAQRYPRLGMEIEDLVQEGNLGLLLAAPRFDVTRGTRFLTYAGYWVQQRILRALSENCSLIRWPAHMVEELTRANLDGECASLPAGQRSIESLSHVRDSRIVGIAAGDEPMAAAERSIVTQPIMKAVGTLKPRYRTVMVLRYGLDRGGERTLREIGKAIGVTGTRVQQIERRCLEILEKRIPKAVRDVVIPANHRSAAGRGREGPTGQKESEEDGERAYADA